MEPTNPDSTFSNERATAFDADEEPVTARSFAAIIPNGSVPFAAPKRQPSFFHRQAAVQWVASAAFGAIVLASVGRILALPPGGREVAGSEAGVREPNLTALRLALLSPRTVATVHSVTATGGGLDQVAVEGHVVSASAQFSACYDWAARHGQVPGATGDLAVVVNLDHLGSVVGASSQGRGLPGLNACIARLAERLGTLLKSSSGPSRLAWTVSYGAGSGALDPVDTQTR